MFLAPTLFSHNGKIHELSIHECNKHFIREMKHIFPCQELSELTAVIDIQKSMYDLVNFGEKVDLHRDDLLEHFVSLASQLCNKLQQLGYWADYMDPCSGLPMLTDGCNKVYSEVDGIQHLLKYSVMNAGCCKVLMHPVHGSSIYPATMFTNCPSNITLDCIREICVAINLESS